MRYNVALKQDRAGQDIVSLVCVQMEGAMWQLVAALWLAWAGPLPARAKYVEGELSTGENWSFLARFCFLSLSGMFEYDIEYPEVGRVTLFVLDLYTEHTHFHQILDLLQGSVQLNQCIL
jgi:hypothetical protein